MRQGVLINNWGACYRPLLNENEKIVKNVHSLHAEDVNILMEEYL